MCFPELIEFHKNKRVNQSENVTFKVARDTAIDMSKEKCNGDIFKVAVHVTAKCVEKTLFPCVSKLPKISLFHFNHKISRRNKLFFKYFL